MGDTVGGEGAESFVHESAGEGVAEEVILISDGDLLDEDEALVRKVGPLLLESEEGRHRFELRGVEVAGLESFRHGLCEF